MHEASIVEGMLKLALDAVAEYQHRNPGVPAPRITHMECDLGLLSCVEEQTLAACFEIFAEGTLADGAILEFNRLPLDCHCDTCGSNFQLKKPRFICPICKDNNIKFSGGSGFLLRTINIDCGDQIND